MELEEDDEKVLKKVDKILARNNPFFKNLDLILAKQNQVSIQLALLKHETKQLEGENDDLKVIMREVFHNLAISSDLAGDGLLSTRKKYMVKPRRKKRRPKPISYQGMLVPKNFLVAADIRYFLRTYPTTKKVAIEIIVLFRFQALFIEFTSTSRKESTALIAQNSLIRLILSKQSHVSLVKKHIICK